MHPQHETKRVEAAVMVRRERERERERDGEESRRLESFERERD